MSGIIEVRIALETRLVAIASPLPTQWENSVYTPLDGIPYQRAFLLFADPSNPEMGSFYQEIGFMQIDLRYPFNKGPKPSVAKAQSIRDWFYRGLTLTANDLTVAIDRTPSVSPAYLEGDRYVTSVRVPFFANNIS